MNKRRPILSVRNLHRSYKSGGGMLTVMAGADIDIYPGEMVGLIGPSGSGKSTAARCITGLLPPRIGHVEFDGQQLRPLSTSEIGQIAGRAGRHMNDGTFGATPHAGSLRPEIIEAVEADDRAKAVGLLEVHISTVHEDM